METIFALSSGRPPAAIALVRVSGPHAAATLQALAGRLPPPRRASLATLRDPAGDVLDRAMLLWFPGPATATGEDLCELHLHGGRAVVDAVLAALAGLPGLRPAEAGEFTRRAFANGRIDLAEAEGLADLLTAETEAQRRQALLRAEGYLSRRIEAWQRRLLAAAAHVEARLDFADEGDVGGAGEAVRDQLDALAADIGIALASPPAERLRDGIRVVIAGPPNAGKSTLLNRLIGREAAIVSPIAGTTRDVVEAPVAIGGLPFLLSDTAGLRASDDAIEQIGIARAERALAGADILLWLGEEPPPPGPAHVIRVAAKADLEGRRGFGLPVSALHGTGIDALAAVLQQAARRLLPGGDQLSYDRRQRALLAETRHAILAAGVASDELVQAEELRRARLALDRITGAGGVEDMLDALFGRFCIGK